jgi:ABC-type multidrug transport system fused ATPase/permease subunit
MTATDTAPPPREAGAHLRRARDYLAVIVSNPWPVAALMALLAAQAALEPAAAWIAKTVIDFAAAPGFSIEGFVADYALIFFAIFAAQSVVKFGEKIANKAVETRLIITLQRTYLARRAQEDAATDASLVLWGCEQAKKGVEVIYKDAWKIVATTTSVLVWQVSLGAEWLPLMLLAVLPSLALVWAFGGAIQRYSQSILDLQRALAASTRRDQSLHFEQHQETWFRQTLLMEGVKWVVDDALDLVMWAMLIALVLLAWRLDLGLLPATIELGGAAAFLVNVRLIAKPLGDIGKVYGKWREAFPAATRVFQGD